MISQGHMIEDVEIYLMGEHGPQKTTARAVLGQGKTVLFGVPGAFTPTCSAKHLPGFLNARDRLNAKGVDRIVCMSVNDAFVMAAWGKGQSVGDHITMLADGSANLTRSMGLELDLTSAGFGIRCKRFVMILDDGVVSYLAVEQGGEFKVSSAEAVLEVL